MKPPRIDEWDVIGAAGVSLLIAGSISHWGSSAAIVSGAAICVAYLYRELRVAKGRN